MLIVESEANYFASLIKKARIVDQVLSDYDILSD